MRDLDAKIFGQHVRSYRKARGYTQEALAAVSMLSADTIRRLEHGSFSPSLATLRKLCRGFEVTLATFFEAYELGDRQVDRELTDLIAGMSAREQSLLLRLIPIFRELVRDQNAAADDDQDLDGAKA